MTIVTRTLGLALALGTLTAVGAAAQDLGSAEGDVILTVSGGIENTNGDGTASFDLAMLQALEPVTVETSTIWT